MAASILDNRVRVWACWILSVVGAAGVVLSWPDLFLFSKVSHLPAWVGFFPDPLMAAWLLLVGPLALALPGSKRFRDAVLRLLALSFLGPGMGAVFQSCLWSLDATNTAVQVGWVFATCVLPPSGMLLLVAALRARRAANPSFKPNPPHGFT